MKRYLSTIHERPDHHKRRFALLVSGGFTILIFAAWVLINFGQGGALTKSDQIEAERAHPDVSPFQSMSAEISASAQAIKDNLSSFTGKSTIDTNGQ